MTLPRPSRPGRRAAVAGALAGLGLAACSGGGPGGSGASSAPPERTGAEPADAPTPSVEPAGRVADVGYAPEGLVRDPATGLLALGVRRPDRLLVLDPRTLAVRRSVPVPGSVRHLGLATGGGTVLVPNEGDDTLLEVDVRTGATRSTAVGHVPHDAAGAADGDLLVADEFSGSLSVVREGRVVHTFDDLAQPGGVVAVGRFAVVVDVRDWTLTSYDLDTLRRVARVPAGDGPTHAVLAAPGRVAVADTRGGRLLVFDVDPLRQVAALDLGDSPYGLAADPDAATVWVTRTAANEVVGVDVGGDTPRVLDRYPTVRQPNTVAVAPGSRVLWVASRTDGVLQRIAR
ncbi:YncE family protein [Phycicoccus flavus]|uniref:YncE family protein n=1 Tax=Phycicoccus flavus TaxID=2502783 RepID=A0A8T6R4D2_9MICO|nr:YncE family protein [Phycicoccus flavus]NHA69278.1 YncE family protein [Phycicoccus flavus]